MSQPMRAAAALLLFLASTGCTISVERSLEMRRETQPKKVAENQVDILEFLDEKIGRPAERATAIETAVIVAKRDNAKSVDPTLYNRLIAAVKRETQQPKVHPKSEQREADGSYLRSFAVHCLGRLEDPDLASDLLDALSDETLANATSARTQAVAASALVPIRETVRSTETHRQRLLAAIASLRQKFPAATLKPEAQDRERLFAFWVVELKTIPNLTQLVQNGLKNDVPPEELLEALTWNYQVLANSVQTKRPAVKRDVYDACVGELVKASSHKDARVRHAARATLLEVAPGALFQGLVKKVAAAPPTKEDLDWAVCLLPSTAAASARYTAAPLPEAEIYQVASGATTLNETALLKEESFAKLKKSLLATTFATLAKAKAERREYPYSVLYAHDPVALAQRLVEVEPVALAEAEPELRQHVRILGNLVQGPALAQDPAVQKAAASSLARLIGRDSAPIRRQVASYLLESQPDLLAHASLPSLKTIVAQSDEGAHELLDVYLSCLRRLEASGKAKAAGAVRGGPLYVGLAPVFERPDARLRAKAVAFLVASSPPALIDIIVKVVEGQKQPFHFDVAVLGETLLDKRSELGPSALKDGVDTLAAALRRADEEGALLAVRYLAEIKDEGALEAIDTYRRSGKCKWKAVLTVVEAVTSRGGRP